MDWSLACLGLLAVVALGLAAGALLAEACVLVPFWRGQQPDAFLTWYREHAGLLLQFFGSLEAASGLFVVAATTVAWLGDDAGKWLFSGSTVLTVGVLLTFPLYFQRANASFATGSLPRGELASELKRWAAWQWSRTILAILAFVLAVLGVR